MPIRPAGLGLSVVLVAATDFPGDPAMAISKPSRKAKAAAAEPEAPAAEPVAGSDDAAEQA